MEKEGLADFNWLIFLWQNSCKGRNFPPMNLRDKLKEDTILFPIRASTMEDAIQEQLDHLQNLDILTGTDILFSIIKSHEENLPSAAGRGIVYPHAISKEVKELVCVLGI